MKGLIFTYLLSYGGAVVSLFNPFIGLLIYVCFAIIRPESLWPWSVPPGNYSRTVAIGLLLGWAGTGFGDWRLGRAGAVVSALVGFWVWVFIGTLGATNHDRAWLYLEDLSKIVLPVLVGVTTINSVRRIKQLAWVIVLSHGYIAYDFNLNYFQGNNYLAADGFGPMDNNCVAIALVTCTGLALFLGLGAPRWWQKALALGVSLLLIHAVLFSFSRGGMLALIISGVIGFVLIPKRPKHYLAFAAIVLIGIRLAGPQVIQRFGSSFATGENRDASAQSRLVLWSGCIDAMQQRPIFGAGPDHWGLIVEQYGFRAGKEAHTLWLQLGAELGIPGLAFLLSYYGLCVVRLWPLLREGSPVVDPWLRDAARMVIASLVGFVVAAQFVSLDLLEVPYYVAMIGAGVLKVNATASRAYPLYPRAI